MPEFLSRRTFLGSLTTIGVGCSLGVSNVFERSALFARTPDEEPLLDWSEWEHYRDTVKHPCLTIQPRDLEFARGNMRQYAWARDHVAAVEGKAKRYLDLMTPEFLTRMIEETTPGDPLWTPCPSCRDQHKPYHPHGLWSWKVEKPDHLICDMCGAIFPNDGYPEEIVFHTKWGKAQTITYYGGDTFPVFGYDNGRPGFSANIRSRKVRWMADYCHTLAETFVLTGDSIYGVQAKNILLRFADCYPHWLIHVGYGEYADMDPRVAAQLISNLPAPEICPPPNKPDNKLWTGFWSAGRATGVGLESDFIRKVVTAYDLTCAYHAPNGRPVSVYSDEEKRKIEKDLLLESTILLVCDKSINNKSVSNRTAVALVGMCVGHPRLVRFGLEGFYKTMDERYLDDGATEETPFYGLMTLGGIWDMAQAARGFSDPPGYKDSEGNRIDSLDLYHNSPFHLVWDAFFKGLQGDLNYPPYADSFHVTNLDTAYVELMVANYPDRSEYLALLREKCGKNLAAHSGTSTPEETTLELPYGLTKPSEHSSFSLYYREPGLEGRPSPALKLPDWCPSDLRIGHLRTGNDGRESLLLMSASHWGVHHELDSLNLYYWKQGAEILSDLGYLWDHPLKKKNIRTLAHNTVLIDEKDQASHERGGEVLFFKTYPHLKAMEMSSNAYPVTKQYRRTSAIIDHGDGYSYVIDFFRVEGGSIQDYVFHGVQSKCVLHDLKLHSLEKPGALYDFTNIRTGAGSTVWRATWQSAAGMTCVAWSPGQQDEQVFVADGWGQRDWKNGDAGTTVPYIVRRSSGEGEKLFISVFEGYRGTDPFVKNVVIDKKGIIQVETMKGTDYILSLTGSGTLNAGKGKNRVALRGHFAAASVQDGKMVWSYALE